MFSSQNSQVSNGANYIEECFSTYLYTGTGASQTITNGIDLSTKGGLVWTKTRSGGAGYDWHVLVDSARGVTKVIETNLTDAEATQTDLTSFTTTGYNLAAGSYYGNFNFSGAKFVSWTFRKQPKFFDVVTYTGNDVIGRQIPHNLGSVPGCIIVKQTNAAREWAVYHTSLGNTQYINLNTAGGAQTQTYWNNTSPTSTNFTVGDWGAVNGGGNTYVAYLFAHNAGGFGLTGTDNVISCGSFTSNSLGIGTVNLGYEPQWVMFKTTATEGNWQIFDNMRGLPARYQNFSQVLTADTSNAESNTDRIGISATGFTTNTNANEANIYIAIRRGPMKVPTSGTSVFLPTARTGNASLTTVTSGFATDVVLARRRDTLDNTNESVFADKLRGGGTLSTTLTDAEYAGGATSGLNAYTNTGVVIGTNNSPIYAFNYSGLPYALYQFRRAPSFFDEVCYTGNATSGATQTHNLGVVPEMMIVKNRSSAGYDWFVYHKNLTSAAYYLNLNSTAAESQYWNAWNSTQPTSSVFTIGNYSAVNASGNTYVAYLFATCAGVSKVGSYTGTGTTKQVDCGFTGGARFVLIKRTDSTGDWYVWDTARGIVSGNDPYLLLNSTAAETTGTDYIDTYSAGFEISSTAPAAINASGGTFIFLAIA